jgi:hypothetical protein
MRLPKFWNLVAKMLDRIPSGLGIPLLVGLAVVIWIVALKLFGL